MTARQLPLFSAFMVIALAIRARAAHAQGELKIEELATDKVKVSVPATGAHKLVISGVEDTNCNVVVASTTATIASDGVDGHACDGVFHLDPEDLKNTTQDGLKNAAGTIIPFKLQSTTPMVIPGAISLTWSTALAAASPLQGKKSYYYADGWHTLNLVNPGDATSKERTLFVVASPGAPPETVKVGMDKPPPLSEAEKAQKARDQATHDCLEAINDRRGKGVNVLCFVHQGAWSRLPVGEVVMRPNSPLLVLAYARSGEKVKIDLTGDVGFTDPTFRNETGRVTGARDGEEFEPLVVSSREWPALKPVAHTLTVTAKVGDSEDIERVDIAVDTPYAGAIRIGVAGIFGSARDRSYAVQTLPGSGQAEIVTTEGGSMDAELVLGIAAYLEGGGRTYFTGDRHHWSPYFGIGLVDKQNSSFEFLRSLHVGLEYEVSKQFSIAGTVVGRRVDRLVDGLEVGDPVTGMSVSTRKGYSFGVGVVINVSPDFLKIAKGSMSGFFK